MTKKILVIDGNSIINRAFYGIRPLTNKNGLNTNAIYGTVNIILKNMETVKPDYCAIAFDLKAPTFRHKMYPEYKAGRHAMPDELSEQFPYIKEVCTHLGLKVLALEGYEADDIIGTIAELANLNDGLFAYVLTGDRDSLQLIGSNVSVLLARNKETTVFDTDAFVSKYGVTPDAFVDVKALMGDPSDNIPGIPGIGEKTALKLISEYKSLESIYLNLQSDNIANGLKNKLELGKESAYLSRKLAMIDRHVPIVTSLEEIKYDGINKSKLLALFTELEFGALIKRLELDAFDTNADNPTHDLSVKFKNIDFNQIVSFSDRSDLFAIELKKDAEKYNISIAFDAQTVYKATADFDSLVDYLKSYSSKIIVYDSKNIFKLIDTSDYISFNFDIKLAAYVADSGAGKYDASRLSLKYLSENIQEEDVNPTVYFKLYAPLYSELESTNALSVLTDIEAPLAGILFEMEKTGFKVDTVGLKKYGEALKEAADVIADRIYNAAGEKFNINSPKQLAEILFEKLALPCFKKTKTGYSTNAEVLEKLAPFYPIVRDILEYRQIVKLKSTYTDALVELADENGRVHTSFNQTVTATGRLSSTEPNLQNIPIRTELGRELRKFFIPEDSSKVLIDADYSQIELRLLAVISEDENMISAFNCGIDIHTVTASQVFGVGINEVTPELRKRAKAVNFGIVYGIGDYSLSQDIGVTKKEAGEYIDGYKKNYPKIKKYLEEIVKKAYEDGYVTTMFNRRRYIPELTSSKALLRKFGERVAMNSPIQGTAADIIKISMINKFHSLKKLVIDAKLILQVHDELIIEADRSCAELAAQILKNEMESLANLNVKLTSEVNIGDTWYDCK